ncbi:MULTISPECIES: lipopolysaccharide transport periplasmic protein LptA [unclassified Devosia]|jgi:lipopolysaccharide export system protein LptA|uniref:lipopolysaccharide transport periplasmic protein LptA n=1 Tax=unclassified Devosia TaxID=196773 RepID=UPI00086A1574|nr:MULTISPECIES: lipopolysaccharide transport periplasmic protein LptA [unclassified Devosia]MBN9362664.1 lipopolysaccharide transport periplasmic protein LptA [Devosia sp.]ODS83865.1 MAG: lipopolysaccharide transport periplasmic protein LptA [Devosia sp. SCN 66-27]OJX23850.1 MAG: lipopolysaccharide transport periplasmic protein LptA [Devosia sp. 66-14]
MKQLIAVIVAMMALSLSAQAAEPVNVSADDFTIDQGNNNATFTGNVVITRTGLQLWADKVVVIYGSGGQSDIDSLTATGHVRIKTDSQDATGAQATFDPDTLILKLSGNVTVVNAQGKLNGPELTINLKTNNSVFKGNKGGRVTGVFTPQ